MVYLKYTINTIPIGELGAQEYYLLEKYGNRMITVRRKCEILFNIVTSYTKQYL